MSNTTPVPDHILDLVAKRYADNNRTVNFANYSEPLPDEVYQEYVGQPAARLIDWFQEMNPNVVLPGYAAIFINGQPIDAGDRIPENVRDVQIMAAKKRNGSQ